VLKKFSFTSPVKQKYHYPLSLPLVHRIILRNSPAPIIKKVSFFIDENSCFYVAEKIRITYYFMPQIFLKTSDIILQSTAITLLEISADPSPPPL